MNTKYLLLLLCFLCMYSGLFAQEDNSDEGSTSVALSKEVISPSTLLWQLQLEEKIVTKYSNLDGTGQNFRLRMIIPVPKGKVIPYSQLIRLIGFYNTVPGSGSGFGDVTFNQFFILQEKSWGDWGLGYNVQIPTASKPEFGSPQVGIGPAVTLSVKNLGNWEMYYIVQNFFTVSRNDEFGKKATMVFQPNIFYTWPTGFYMGIEPLWQLDFKSGAIDFPLNYRFGYIFKSGKYKYNTYVEPEWNTYRSDDFVGNNQDFAVKLGFRIFFPEKGQ